MAGADSAIRWAPDVWAPGETIHWYVAGDDPDWATEWFGSPEGFVPVLEKALAVWSAVETADISWRSGGVRYGFDERAYPPRGFFFVGIAEDVPNRRLRGEFLG